MNSFILAGRAIAFAAAANLTPAAAQTQAVPNDLGSQQAQTTYAAPAQNVTGTPHWEWQYHYVGRHARYEGHWVLVR